MKKTLLLILTTIALSSIASQAGPLDAAIHKLEVEEKLRQSIIEGQLAPDPPTVVRDKNPRLTVGANTLRRAFERNAIAAQQRYNNHWTTIVGTVSDIGRDFHGKAYVVLGTDEFEAIQCYFDEYEETEIAKLRKGQPVAIIGDVQGLDPVGMHVEVQECMFTEIPVDKTEVRRAIAVTE
jgi:hypothetical protein